MIAAHRKARLLRLLPALIWLAAQMSMSGVFGAGAASATTGEGVRTIVICTAAGLAQVALDADGQPIDPDAATGSLCEWCQAFGAVVTPDAPADAARIAFSNDGENATAAADVVLVAQLSERPYLSRGPPL